MTRSTSLKRVAAGAVILVGVALLGGNSPGFAQIDPDRLLRLRRELDVLVPTNISMVHPYGTIVSGDVLGLGPESRPTIKAIGMSDSVFEGAVREEAGTWRFRMVVPSEAQYYISVCHITSTDPRNAVVNTYADPDPVVVERQDVSRDVTPSAPLPAGRVEGRISGLDPEYPFNGLRFTASNTHVAGDVLILPDDVLNLSDGVYNLQLQDNEYRITLLQLNSDATTRRALGLGSVVVDGREVRFDSSVPPQVPLSGNVTIGGDPSPLPGIVTAIEATAPAPDPFSCNGPPAAGGETNVGQGRYSLTLQPGVEYNVEGTVFGTLGSNERDAWMVRHTLPIDSDVNDVNLDFNYPTPPQPVTITGVVSAPDGQPVEGTTICASSNELVGVPGSFRNCTDSDFEGNYTLRVFPGRNYTVVFTPPFQPF